MEWTPDNIERLERLFRDRFEDFVRRGTKYSLSELWLDFCDKYEVVQMGTENLKDCFNFGPDRHRQDEVVCIENPEPEHHFLFLLVPKKFAEKCLVLGFVPT